MRYALVFLLLLALLAALLGFSSLVAVAVGIVRGIFYLLLAIFTIVLPIGLLRQATR